jgi:phosphotriesterase-related protein
MKGLSRREWIAGSVALLGGGCASGGPQGPAASAAGLAQTVQTVTGALPADRLGLTLMHEHVLVDFIGASQVSARRYDVNQVFMRVLPYLTQARALGCETLVECTPAYLGRDPGLLRRLSDASGVHIVSNTGFYGAAKDKHLPPHAFTETAEQLARRWIREVERGIEGTSIKPGFLKIGVDEGVLSDIDSKLVRAAALTHRETGLPIASHTTTGVAAMETIALLDRAGVPPSALIWVHAHSERDETFHTRAGRTGAWVEFDGISVSTVARHVELVERMKAQGLLGHVLVSHDAGWYRVGEPGGGQFRPYDTLFTSFVPALRAAGFDEADIRQMLVSNPSLALSRRRPQA